MIIFLKIYKLYLVLKLNFNIYLINMFAEYNYDNFPVVFVSFSETINSENEFDQFLNEWLILYHTRNMKINET